MLDSINNYGQAFKSELQKARMSLSKFELVPMYTDLYQFFESVDLLIDQERFRDTSCSLKNNLMTGKNLLDQAVIAHAAGDKNSQTHGISIYLPLSHIDTSYATTFFGKNSSWLSFLDSYRAL